MTEQAVPVGGRLMTPAFKLLLMLIALGALLGGWRFAVGLGASTGLNDGYPWGLWIAFDVVTGTALACGGYAVAILVYVLNRGQYHPLVRPALLTSALGYSVAAVAIVLDVGRPWGIWKIPASPQKWNLDSALLEVALCVMAYTAVLWIEMAPALLERWKGKRDSGILYKLANGLGPWLERNLIWFIAAGLVLPTMHQSSLGTVMLLAGHRLHRLWHTPLVPLLFLLSCVAMGYAVVVLESLFSHKVFGRKPALKMLNSLGRVMVFVLAGFLVIRFADLLFRGRIGLAFEATSYAAIFWFEVALTALPIAMLAGRGHKLDIVQLARAAMVMIIAGALYRFDTYLVAFQPGEGWSYFPTIPELLITIGIVAFEIAAYVAIVKFFPILGGAPAAEARR